MRLLNSGLAAPCPNNDCGPRMVDGVLRLYLTDSGFGFWVSKKKNPPKLKYLTAGERAAQKQLKKERGSNPYGVGDDQESPFNLGVISSLVNIALADKECIQFY